MTNSRSIQTELRLDLATIEQLVPDLVAKQLGFERDEVLLSSRLIEDLGCDSLELIELIMELEDQFNITIPDKFDDPVGKSMFTRSPFCIRDLAEIVYLQHGTGTPVRSGWHRKITSSPKPVALSSHSLAVGGLLNQPKQYLHCLKNWTGKMTSVNFGDVPMGCGASCCQLQLSKLETTIQMCRSMNAQLTAFRLIRF